MARSATFSLKPRLAGLSYLTFVRFAFTKVKYMYMKSLPTAGISGILRAAIRVATSCTWRCFTPEGTSSEKTEPRRQEGLPRWWDLHRFRQVPHCHWSFLVDFGLPVDWYSSAQHSLPSSRQSLKAGGSAARVVIVFGALTFLIPLWKIIQEMYSFLGGRPKVLPSLNEAPEDAKERILYLRGVRFILPFFDPFFSKF